jgi:hypothetical protein
VLESSLLQAEDTIFSSNGFINAAAFQASRFQCTRCTLADPGGGVGANGRTNLLAAAGASIVVAESTFINGGVNSNAASVLIFDSTVNGFAPNGASLADGQSTVNLTRTQLSGHIVLSNGSNTQLFGVTQTLATPFNIVDNNSFIRIGDAPPAAGGPPSIPSSLLGFSVRGFSNGMLLQNSQINGNLNCTQGGNTFCAVPAKVTGSSNCALCPKP